MKLDKKGMLALLAGVALLTALILQIGINNILQSLRDANLLLLLPALPLMWAVIAFKSARYAFLASRIGGDRRSLFRIAAFGLLFNQLSVAASELSKAALFKRATRAPAAAAAVPSVIERSMDIAVLASFALVGLLSYAKTPLLFLLPGLLAAPLPFLERILRDVRHAYGAIGTRTVLLMLAMTFGLWLAESTVFQMIFLALGFQATFFQNIAAVSLSFLIPTSMLLTIGGLEANMVVLYGLMGAPQAIVLAGAIIYRLFVVSAAATLSLKRTRL